MSQSARDFHKKLIEILKVIYLLEINQILALGQSGIQTLKNIIVIDIYVDDCLVIGKQLSVSKLIE
jgi:hypothetical protein